jgi:hypothetical protein
VRAPFNRCVSLKTGRSSRSFEEGVKIEMNEKKITIQFKYPWTMMPLASTGEWINAVSKSLSKADPLYGKKIFVSGRHETENLILVDNDTDDNYGIVSFAFLEESKTIKCNTVEILHSRKSLAEKLQSDHEKTVSKFK